MLGRTGAAANAPQVSAEQLLREARALVAAGWSQQARARDADSQPTDPWSPSARSWSVIGALVAAWASHRPSGSEREAAIRAFQEANLALLAVLGDSPASWNDAPGRTQQEALAALDRAIERVASTGAPPR